MKRIYWYTVYLYIEEASTAMVDEHFGQTQDYEPWIAGCIHEMKILDRRHTFT